MNILHDVDAVAQGNGARPRVVANPLDVVRLALDAFSSRVLKFTTMLLAFALFVFVSWQPTLYPYLAAVSFAALVTPAWWRKESA